MYCTTCEIITEELSHYKTQLHAINIKRKLVGYTPLSLEEFESDSKTDELIFDLHHNHTPEVKESKPLRQPKTRKVPLCMFCEQEESIRHYKEHGVSEEQLTYLLRSQCHICYERFISKEVLLKHLESGNHRTTVTDGQSLYLMNGVVLHPSRRQLETTCITKADPEPAKKEPANPKLEYFLDQKRRGDLKCSLHSARSIPKMPF